MHSQFLFVIPSDWRTLEGDALDVVDVNLINGMIAVQDYTNMTDHMRNLGFITQDESVVEARVFESVIMAYRV